MQQVLQPRQARSSRRNSKRQRTHLVKTDRRHTLRNSHLHPCVETENPQLQPKDPLAQPEDPQQPTLRQQEPQRQVKPLLRPQLLLLVQQEQPLQQQEPHRQQEARLLLAQGQFTEEGMDQTRINTN